MTINYTKIKNSELNTMFYCSKDDCKNLAHYFRNDLADPYTEFYLNKSSDWSSPKLLCEKHFELE